MSNQLNIFLLEDDPYRIVAFEAALVPKHKLTIKRWLQGPGGAYRAWEPPYDLVLLDHDLGGRQFQSSFEAESGYAFARYLGGAKPEDRSPLIVHSWNPTGADNMHKMLDRAGWPAFRWPFGKELIRFLANLDTKDQLGEVKDGGSDETLPL